MKRLVILLLAVVAAAGAWARLPEGVLSLLPQLDQAERRLQDTTLAHEAARREALPAESAVAEARRGEGTWWGDWRLRRALARLKDRLDAVETARRSQAQAQEGLYVMLTAAEEELRGALEKGLARHDLGAEASEWWQRLQAWSRRLEALESAPAEARDAGGLRRSRLLAQARLEQIERDERLWAGLKAAGLLEAPLARSSKQQLVTARRRWARLVQGQAGP